MRREILSNFGISLLIVFFGLIGSVIIAKTLGPEKRGEVAAAVLWPSLLLYVGSMGTYQSVIFFYSKNKRETLMVGNSLVVCLLNSIISVTAGYFLINYCLGNATSETKRISIFLLYSLPFSMLSMFITSIFQAKQKFKTYNLLRVVIPVTYLVGILILKLYDRLTVKYIILLQISLNVFLAFLCLGIYQFVFQNINKSQVNLKSVKMLYGYGFKSWFGELSQSMTMKIDQVFISNLFSTKELGLYVVAYSLASFSTTIANSFRTILFPTIAKTALFFNKISLLQKSYKTLVLINAVVVFLGALMLPYIIPILYGKAYEDAYSLAVLLLIAFIFYNIKTVVGSGLQAFGQPESVSKAEFLGLVSLALMMWPLGKNWGVKGATVAILIAYIVQFSIINFYFLKLVRKGKLSSALQ